MHLQQERQHGKQKLGYNGCHTLLTQVKSLRVVLSLDKMKLSYKRRKITLQLGTKQHIGRNIYHDSLHTENNYTKQPTAKYIFYILHISICQVEMRRDLFTVSTPDTRHM